MKPRRKIPDPRIKMAEAEAQLQNYLVDLRPHMRADVTAAGIAKWCRCSPTVIEYRLTLAQQNWAGEGTA